jgi:glycosyltransferase involved in cell wall biosynthesis
MKILWISGREIGSDLASSTEVGIFTSLVKLGHDVQIMSPGENKKWGEKHIKINNKKFPGLVTITGAIDLGKKIDSILFEQAYDFILIDWRYVYFLRKRLSKLKIPWFMVDRGPPVYKNWKLRLQKITWKKSWKFSRKHCKAGIIVSSNHANFIERYADVKMNFIIAPSGTSFPSLTEKKEYNILNFIYIGQIDKRRDIDSIIKLKETLDKFGVRNNITIIGEGDYKDRIKKLTSKISDFNVLSKMKRDDINIILKRSHFGLMPMPKIPIWEMSSPIKISEYARNGLIIIGPKHEGNMWGRDVPWIILSEKKDWWEDVTTKILKIQMEGNLEKYSLNAIQDSDDRTWDNIAAELINEVEKYI